MTIDGRLPELPMTWVGLGLHKRCVTACAVSDSGEMLAEHRRLLPDVRVLLAWITALPGPVTVALEATLYWAWLLDHFVDSGIAVVAANAYQVKLTWSARNNAAPSDARKLADLLRVHLFPAVWVPTPILRAQRTLLQGRSYLVRRQTSVRDRIHAHLTAENCRSGVTDLYGVAASSSAERSVVPMGPRGLDGFG